MNPSRRLALTALASATALAIAPAAFASPALAAARSAAAKRAAQASAQRAEAQAAAHAAGKPHDVVISRSRHPQAAAHIEHAQRHGQPTVLQIDRAGAHDRRSASTGSVNPRRKPAANYERDEYPPAFTREGGHNANVRFIDRHDNRGAGAMLRAQTHHLPDGARIRIVIGD
jgi:hypothetical protein